MDKKLIVVTGCSGRIGSEVIKRLKNTYTIIGLDIVPVKDCADNYEFIKVNLSNEDSIKSALEQIRIKYGSKIASFIHLAAYYNFKGGEWDMYEKITVKGTEHLLNILNTFDVEQFIYSSSILVHKPNLIGRPLNENSPISGSWELPRSKILAENSVHNLGPLIPSKITIRLGGVYEDTCNSIPLSNQIQRIYEKQFASHVLPGNVRYGAPFIHMEDLINCIELLVNQRDLLKGDRTYLIAESERLSYDQTQRIIQRELFNREWHTFRIPKWVAKLAAWFQNAIPLWGATFIKPWMIDHAADNYECDVSKAKKEFGWSTTHRLKDTLPKMVEALKENPLKWYSLHQLNVPNWLKKILEK